MKVRDRYSTGSVLVALKNVMRMMMNRRRGYKSINLSLEDIEAQGYKKYLGGGAEAWEKRGAFQLYFLKKMGLQRSSKLLDVGCGPLRAGVHLIRYLNRGNYVGIDYNESFIRAARQTVEDMGLSEKKPILSVVDNFDFTCLDGKFDFMMAFSVLNHCKRSQQKHFFRMAPGALKEDGRLYITHSFWFDDSLLKGRDLSLGRVFSQPTDIDRDLYMPDWGFSEDAEIYPILELSGLVSIERH